MKSTRTYYLFIHEDPKGIWGEFPDLPGCVTEGKDFEDLKKNAEKVLKSWLENQHEHQQYIPPASRKEDLNVDKADRVILIAADVNFISYCC